MRLLLSGSRAVGFGAKEEKEEDEAAEGPELDATAAASMAGRRGRGEPASQALRIWERVARVRLEIGRAHV